MSTDDNMYSALRAAFPEDLDAVAIESADGLHYTWRDLERGSAMVANLLASLELPAGSRIAAQTDKSVEALMLYLAVLRAGFVYLPLNTAYQQAEIEYFVGDAKPAVLVCPRRHFQWASRIAFTAGARHVYTLGDDRTGSLLERASFMRDEHAVVPRRTEDLAVILYTSGTTGKSKGAMLSHGNMLSNALTLKSFWQWSARDVLIHALPLFHIHGLFVACHGALLAGAKMLWFAKFEPPAVIARLPEATVFMGVPTLYVRLLGQSALTREACEHMRLFISGSAPLLPDTFDAFRARTGHTILERYGMSETVMLTSNPVHGQRRAGSVGVPLPGVQVRVRDDAGHACDTGAIGHVEVRGPNVFAGYWANPEKSAQAFTDDGWFKTGDVGRFDADGYLSIVGRSKDLIITGGYNVYPAEVEGFVNALPGVAESAVIGVPHADFGEGVVAVVVPRAGATLAPEDVVAALKGKIAGYKVPKEVFIAPELPRNAMGKVQKNVLRERYKRALG